MLNTQWLELFKLRFICIFIHLLFWVFFFFCQIGAIAIQMACHRIDQRSSVQHVFGCLVIWNIFVGIIFTGQSALSRHGC